MAFDFAMYTDLYQLTMAQGYWLADKGDEQACFHMHFRENPFHGGYTVACGMDQLAEMIETFSFTEEDCAYLGSLEAPAGGPLFRPEFRLPG
jgi:nicotinate phosphoribosyltransferase